MRATEPDLDVRRLIEWHVREGTDGIVVWDRGRIPDGGFRRAPALIDTAVKHPPAAGRHSVTRESRAKRSSLRTCKNRAAHELSVVPITTSDTEGLYRHFRAIAEAVDIRRCSTRPGARSRHAERYRAGLANVPNIENQGCDGESERGAICCAATARFRVYSRTMHGPSPAAPRRGRGISVTRTWPAPMHEMCAAASRGKLAAARSINTSCGLHCHLSARRTPSVRGRAQLGTDAGGILCPHAAIGGFISSARCNESGGIVAGHAGGIVSPAQRES